MCIPPKIVAPYLFNILVVHPAPSPLKEEKSTVTSDYAAIMPMIQGFKAIAYTDDSKIVTKNTCKPELYKTAKEAIENV